MRVAEQFVPSAMPAGLGSVTPPEAVLDGLRAVVARWNLRLPRRRVRIITQQRYRDLRGLLAAFTADQLCAAIDLYAARPWNKAKGVWMTFDHFLLPERATPLVEEAIDAAERLLERAASADRRVRALAAETAARLAADRARADLRRRWDALGDLGRHAYLRRAAEELAAAGMTRDRLRRAALQQHAKAIFAREQPPAQQSQSRQESPPQGECNHDATPIP